jgi:hypothetical protein
VSSPYQLSEIAQIWNCVFDSSLVIISMNLLSFINIALMVLVLLLNMQTIFFGELYSSETRKLVERLINYAIYKVSILTKCLDGKCFTFLLFTIVLDRLLHSNHCISSVCTSSL